MKIQELIDVLSKAKDKDTSDVLIYIGSGVYEIQSIGQFGIVTDLIISVEVKKESEEEMTKKEIIEKWTDKDSSFYHIEFESDINSLDSLSDPPEQSEIMKCDFCGKIVDRIYSCNWGRMCSVHAFANPYPEQSEPDRDQLGHRLNSTPPTAVESNPAEGIGYYYHFKNDDYFLTKKDYEKLLAAQRMLLALEACGVEKWPDYHLAVALYNSEWIPVTLDF